MGSEGARYALGFTVAVLLGTAAAAAAATLAALLRAAYREVTR